MKIHLIVERECGTFDCAWVVDACDEGTMDEHNGAYPSDVQTKLDKHDDGNERRVLIVEIPDDALMRPWETPAVQGQVRA